MTGPARWARGMGAVAGRIGPVPLLVRAGVYLAGLVAILLSVPGWLLFTQFGALLMAVPLLPALRPRGRTTTLVVLLAVVSWLATTTVGEISVSLWRLLALAGALYLLHTLAALAAVLPYDVHAPTVEVFTRWLGQALAIVLASAVLAVLALAAAGHTGDRAMLPVAVTGLAIAVVVTGMLAWLWRRR